MAWVNGSLFLGLFTLAAILSEVPLVAAGEQQANLMKQLSKTLALQSNALKSPPGRYAMVTCQF